MVRKILGIGVVVLLVGALIGGGAYLLLQDSNNGGGGGRGGQNQASMDSSGAHGSRGNGGTGSQTVAERGGGYGSGNSGGNAVGGGGTGTREADIAPEEWLTVPGVVVTMEENLVVRTPDGTDVTFSLGPSWYHESAGVAIAVGDEVQVTGFYEDGELMAGTVENLSSGQALALRDESGQPLWSGRGRRGQ